MKAFINLVILWTCTTGALKSQQTVGLFQNDSTSYNGYTLVAPMASDTTYLIDNCGFVVHIWTSNYLAGGGAYLLEDGSLLRLAQTIIFPLAGAGGKVERLQRSCQQNDHEGQVARLLDQADAKSGSSSCARIRVSAHFT